MLNQTTFIHNVKKNKLETLGMINIFDHIKFDSKLREQTESYRLIPIENIQERKDYKSNFPAFFPTVWLGQTEKNLLTDESLPTGLIQFDLDAKDNDHLDIQRIRNDLLQTPELVYLFISPSGGLKFGIKTDFHKNPGDTIQGLKDRYKVAYGIAKAYALEQLPDLVLDNAVGALKYGCYMSHDPNAFYNPDCNELDLNNRCYAPERPRQYFHLKETVDIERITNLLSSFIPKKMSYEERLKINTAVFSAIGRAGVPLLFNHWNVDDKVKLKKDLDYQADHAYGVSMGYLYKVAYQNGYPPAKTGTARRTLSVKQLMDNALATGQRIEGQKTLEETRDIITREITSFIQNRRNKIISSSVGIGKTHLVLDALKQFNYDQKVLYVSNNHSLLSELAERFNKIKSERAMGSFVSSAIHIKGRNLLCENKTVKEAYGEMPIPPAQCHNDCPLFTQCAYTLQFGQHYHNIRFMASNVLFNHKGHFEDGWRPDFIIIDEDFLKLENYINELNCPWKSVRSILIALDEDVSLEEVIINHSDQLLIDYWRMKNKIIEQNKKPWISMAETIRAMKEERIVMDEILSALYHYSISQDKDFLKGIRVIGKGGKVKLKLSRVPPIHSRWQGIPMLILDATADERVIKHLYPDIEWVSAHAVKDDSIVLIQAENFNITKNFLEKPKNKSVFIDSLNRWIANNGPFEKIGVITYKNITGRNDFDAYLAEQIGAKVFGHFGDIRGKDIFKDCDLLIIAGRHELNPIDLEDWCYGLFNQPIGGNEDKERLIVDIPVRTKNDTAVLIENFVYADKNTEAVRNHICKAETIQAPGRIRWFLNNGKIRKVLYLSSESLGMNIEVDDFISHTKFFDKPKEVDYRSTAEKKRDTHKEKLIAKMESILAQRNFPIIRDNWLELVDLGMGRDTARNKEKRNEIMIAAGYFLQDGKWRINQA